MKFPRVPEQLIWATLALIVMFAIYQYTTNTKKSEYSVEDAMYAPAPAGGKATKCGMKAGTGLASSLLPREVAQQDRILGDDTEQHQQADEHRHRQRVTGDD